MISNDKEKVIMKPLTRLQERRNLKKKIQLEKDNGNKKSDNHLLNLLMEGHTKLNKQCNNTEYHRNK